MKKLKILAFIRSFFITLVLGLCIVSFITGIYITDQNTRAMGTGNAVPAIQMKIEENKLIINFLGSKYDTDLTVVKETGNAAKPLKVLIPPEYRLTSAGLKKLPDMISDFLSSYF